VIPGCLACVAAAEWLHGGGAGWAWAAVVVAVVPWLGGRPRGVAPGLAALATVALGGLLVVGVLQVRQVECCWPAEREHRVTRASQQLAATLAASVAEARRLAERGAVAALLPRHAAFPPLRDALGRGTTRLERGVVILAADGEPWAWAGRHRFIPGVDTAELRAVITPFYVSLEARRQTSVGGTAVGTVLLDASPAVPDRDGAVSRVFARDQGVALRFLPPRLAPAGSDVFDYTTPRGDTLFSVQAAPPTQGDAKLARLTRAAGLAGAGVAAALLLLLAAASPVAGAGSPRSLAAGA